MCVHLEIEVAKSFKDQQSTEKGTQRAVTVPMRVLPLQISFNNHEGSFEEKSGQNRDVWAYLRGG